MVAGLGTVKAFSPFSPERGLGVEIGLGLGLGFRV